MRQSKPLGLCFTCNGDHLKKSCPIELAKRGKINPVSMAELIEFDISLAEDIQGVDEIIQRFEVFLEADEEFTASRARQVAVVDLAGEECGELIARVMADHQVDEDDVETDEGPLEAINADLKNGCSGDTLECLLPVSILSNKFFVVADTGASNSIIAYRTVSIGGTVVQVSCMIVGKASFSMLLGLEVMKPLGAILDRKVVDLCKARPFSLSWTILTRQHRILWIRSGRILERSLQQRHMVIDILLECKDAFVAKTDILPCTDRVQHSIDTGDSLPIYTAPYRCSPAH